MSGGYRPLPEDDLARLVQDIDKIKSDIRQLQMPTGTQVAETVANQLYPAVASSSASGLVVGTSYVTLTSTSVPVPEGFTRAMVSASAFWNAGTSSSGSIIRAFLQIVIGGVAGPESAGLVETDGAAIPMSANASRVFTVTPGGSFTILAQGHNGFNTTDASISEWCVANLTASIIFLR